jgi:hypothetical protein
MYCNFSGKKNIENAQVAIDISDKSFGYNQKKT